MTTSSPQTGNAGGPEPAGSTAGGPAATGRPSTPLLRLLELEPLGGPRYRAPSGSFGGRATVFGGQLLGQTVMAAAAGDSGKRVRQLHTVFARAGAADSPVEFDIAPIHTGRTLGSVTITARQGERTLCRSLVLLDAGEPDVFRQAEPMPAVPGPEDLADAGWAEPGSRTRLTDPTLDLDVTGPNGPPELGVWVSWPGLAPAASPTVHAAAATWYTDPFVIGASMRPHDGFGQAMAHRSLSTAVVSHTLSFHDEFRADEWHLVRQRALHAGGGRVHGRGEVFTRDGRHVASFSQEAVVRRSVRQGAAA